MISRSLQLLCLLLFPCFSLSFTVGPPPLPTVCKTMNPQHHDYKPQKTKSPFKVSVDKTEVKGGEPVQVTLYTKDPEETKFIGFYLQARDENDNPLGLFMPNKDTKAHHCLGLRSVTAKDNIPRQNAAHHASGAVKKDNVTIVWIPPTNFNGEIVMTATMMRDFVTYWVFLESKPVNVNNPNAVTPSPTPTISRTTRKPRPNLNQTLSQLFSNIGAIFTPSRNNGTRRGCPPSAYGPPPELQGNGTNTNDNARVFSQWWCRLFPNAIGTGTGIVP